MRIGEAAAVIGVATHVLRHWEDERVVVPDRTSAGHRTYTEEHLQRLRIVMACQEVGLSLADIRLVLHRAESERTAVIERHLDRIHEQQGRLERAEQFLSHVVGCRHDLVSRCPGCRDYAKPDKLRFVCAPPAQRTR